MVFMSCPTCKGKTNERHGKCEVCGTVNVPKVKDPVKFKRHSMRRAKIKLFKEQVAAMNDLPDPEQYVYRAIRQFSKIRIMKGLTSAEVADRMGLDKSQIINVENGTRKPSVRRLSEMAIAVGARLELVGWE